MYYIYCYTNRSNGHKYVGQTTQRLQNRINEHKSNSLNPNSKEYNLLFHRKLREYGIDNFDIDILENGETDSHNEINEREIYWIAKLRTYVGDGQGGYNLTRGGDNHEHDRIYDLDIINQIKQDLQQNISYSEIHEKYNISMGYISGINNGLYFYDSTISYPIQKYISSKEEIDNIYNLLENTNIPMTEIAKITNKAYSTIKKINYGTLQNRNNFQYPIRKINSAKQKAIQVQEMLLDKTKTIDEIVDLLQVSRATIKRINKGDTHYNPDLIYPLR